MLSFYGARKVRGGDTMSGKYVVSIMAVIVGCFWWYSVGATVVEDCNFCTDEALNSCAEETGEACGQCVASEFDACLDWCCSSGCESNCLDEYCGPLWEECEIQCDDDNATCQASCGGEQSCLDGCEATNASCHAACQADMNTCYNDCYDPCVDDCLAVVTPPDPDCDGDGVADGGDNCPYTANTGQEDGDGDGVGDVCDNCVADSNPDQSNGDGDCFGDVCDKCPALYSNDPVNPDTDGDGLGDGCDPDIDGDTVANVLDNCPFLVNAGQEDTDGDGFGDVCDTDLALPQVTIKDITANYEPFSQQVELIYPYPDGENSITMQPVDALIFSPFDIDNSGGVERIVGYAQEGCQVSRCGAYLGQDSPNAADPGEDDPLRFRILFAGLPTSNTFIMGIDDANHFVGRYWDGDLSDYGFWAERTYSPEQGLYYYSYHQLAYPEASSTSAWDLTSVAGQINIVGRHWDSLGGRGYRYNAATDVYTPIQVPKDATFGADITYPNGINADGKVVGYYQVGTSWPWFYHGFICDGDGTGIVPIDVPGANNTFAYRINDSGIVLGYYDGALGGSYGFIYDTLTGQFKTFQVPGAQATYAFGFNNNGRIVGYYRDETGVHAFVGGPLFSAGDVNGSGTVDLADSITALKVVAGDPPGAVERTAKLPESATIGMPEAIHVLESLAQ